MKFDTNTYDFENSSVFDFDDDFDQGTLECWALDELSDVVPSDFSAAVGCALLGLESVTDADAERFNEFD